MTQQTVTIAHWVANLSHPVKSLADFAALVEQQLAKAAAEKADILLAPEHISEYWMGFAPPHLTLSDEPGWIADQSAQILPLLQAAVIKNGVALVAGSFSFKHAITGKYRNRSYMFFPDREPVFHDKFVMTPSEKDPNGWFFETGDTLNVFDWRGMRLSLIICLDVEMPHLSHIIAAADIDLLLVPSMTLKPAGYYRVFNCARARAVEMFTAVAVVGCVDGATGSDGHKRDAYHGGAAVYIPAEEVFGHTGVFTDLPLHNTSGAAGLMLLSRDIPIGHIRAIRQKTQSAPEAWPGVWDAGHIKTTCDTPLVKKVC